MFNSVQFNQRDKNSKLVDFQKILPFVLQYNLSKKVLQDSY